MHLCTVKTVIWQICSNRPGKKVLQSAHLSAGGGGNRYRGDIFCIGASLRLLVVVVDEAGVGGFGS